MPEVDAYLDPKTGDLPEINRLTTGMELIQQRIRLRLRRGVGEWFLDPTTGLPLIEWREQKPPRVEQITSQIQVELRSIPGVVATRNFSGTHDPAARRLTIYGDVVAADNQVTSVVVTGTTTDHNTQSFGVFFSSGNIVGGIPRPTARRP